MVNVYTSTVIIVGSMILVWPELKGKDRHFQEKVMVKI